MGKKAAIILSGCGFLDGAEIHESVLSYLALSEAGIEYDTFAPDKEMEAVTSHLTKKPLPIAGRNVLEESARIARCEISSIEKLKSDDYDILWMPGGFGVATNLSDFATKSTDCEIHPELDRVIKEFYAKKKAIVGICLAPVVLAKALEGKGIEMTLGSNPDDLENLKKLGMIPKSCHADEITADKAHLVFTAPGYMEPPEIKKIFISLKKITDHL